jgi:hypothetical protein
LGAAGSPMTPVEHQDHILGAPVGRERNRVAREGPQGEVGGRRSLRNPPPNPRAYRWRGRGQAAHGSVEWTILVEKSCQRSPFDP